MKRIVFSGWRPKCLVSLVNELLYNIYGEIKRKTGVKTQKSAFSPEEGVLNDTFVLQIDVLA